MRKLLTILLFLVSCQKVDSPMKNSQIFRLSFPYDANTLDPRKNSDYVGSTVHFMLFEGLTRMTPNSTHELAIADSISISEDKKVYRFHLKPTFWSDGTPLTADDFVFSWKSLLDPSFPAPNAHLFYPIKNAEKIKLGDLPLDQLGVRALDPYILEVTLEVPTPYFLDLTSFCPFFPVPSHTVKKNTKWADNISSHFVTNGPFILKKWAPMNEYIFGKNEKYWDSDSVHLDEIHVTILDNELTGLGLFENDELDFYGAYNSIPSDSILKLQKEEKLITQPFGATTFLTFNLADSIFKNKNMRKAFSLPINRLSLIENITQCNETVALGAIPPLLKPLSSKSFFQDHEIEAGKFHLKAGLDELELTKGDLGGITLLYPSNGTYRRLAQAIQEEWRKAFGISVKLEESEFKITLDKFQRRDYQIGLNAWLVQYNDQMNILDRFKLKSNLKNYPGFQNEKYTTLLDESAFAETPEKRFEILEAAEELITEENPFTPLYHWNCIYLLQDRIHGFFISPIGSIHLNYITIDEGS